MTKYYISVITLFFLFSCGVNKVQTDKNLKTSNKQMEKNKPKLLILTGPQGSGNHLFAKIFSSHESVRGWDMEHDEWEGHHVERFSLYWRHPKIFCRSYCKIQVRVKGKVGYSRVRKF